MNTQDFDWKKDYYDKLSKTGKHKLHINQLVSIGILFAMNVIGVMSLFVFNDTINKTALILIIGLSCIAGYLLFVGIKFYIEIKKNSPWKRSHTNSAAQK